MTEFNALACECVRKQHIISSRKIIEGGGGWEQVSICSAPKNKARAITSFLPISMTMLYLSTRIGEREDLRRRNSCADIGRYC